MSRSLRFFDFHGIVPRLDETLLDAMNAMVAEDIDLSRGDLMPWKWATTPSKTVATTILTVSDTEESCECVTWDEVIDVDLGQPVCSDIGMMFWIEDGVVMQATRSEVCQGISEPLGVACPNLPPTGGSSASGEGCTTTESYCYTYVNQYNQEGPPSPPSLVSTADTGITSITIPASVEPYKVHVYRAAADGATGREGTQDTFDADGAWVRVGEGLTGTTIQTRPLSSVAETLRSTRFAPPPTGVTSLRVCPSTNALMLAKDNMVYISHPGQYHAFPRDRDLTLQDNVVGLIDYSETIIALTDGHPYIIRPINLKQKPPIYEVSRLDDSVPCVSKASIAVSNKGVVWASTDGLFIIANGRYGISLDSLTSLLFHLDDWREIEPHTIRADIYNGAYYFTGDGDATCSITGHKAHTWILNFDDGAYSHPDNISLTSLSIRPDTWHRTRTDKFYYSLGNELYEWNPIDGEERDYTYVTRDTIFKGLTSLGAAKVHHDIEKVVNFSIYKEVCTKVRKVFGRRLNHCEPFRTPLCLTTIHQYVKIISKSRVRSIHLATSVIDLTNHQDSSYDYGNTRQTQRRQ